MSGKKVGFVCFGEINTPYDKLQIKHDEALASISNLNYEILDAGIVTDDPEYKTADSAIGKLKNFEMDCLIVCVAGWIPTHAVIRVTDAFRHIPILLWGLSGWSQNGRLVTTAPQAGTTAIRPALEAFGYHFKYIYNVIGRPVPAQKIDAFVSACHAGKCLRKARVGTMGYRDMLLYGTQYEGNSLRGKIGVEVEPFEMLEMVRNIEHLDAAQIQEAIDYVKKTWKFIKPCDDKIIEQGVQYALAIGKKIRERGYDAVTLIDVDGMKKLLGFPPAMVFMLLEHYYGVLTIPENDVMGAVTQLIMKYISGQMVPYLEYYEFFEKSMLIGVPDFITKSATDGDVTVLPTAFGLLSASLLNVSRVKTGYVTCVRLVYLNGKYKMHVYTADAKTPPKWEECGWEAPAPQLPSLEVFPDATSVEEFAQKVSSQHVIVVYGDYTETLADFCRLNDIEMI
jgi:L-fucose isomerase-like protein